MNTAFFPLSSGRSPQIYQCDDFLSSEECEAIRSFAEAWRNEDVATECLE